MAAIDFTVQMLFLAGLRISYSSHLATFSYQASPPGGWEGAPPADPYHEVLLLPQHTSLSHSQLPFSPPILAQTHSGAHTEVGREP